MAYGPAFLWGQVDTSWQEYQRHALPAGTDTVALDSFAIVDSSIVFRDSLGQRRRPTFALVKEGRHYLLLDTPLPEPLRLRYRRLPLAIAPNYQRKDTSLILPASTSEVKVASQQYQRSPGSSSGFDPFAGLQSQGSISRSISVGNNQDAVLNSALNLQLTGNIAPKTKLRASITDNQVPVQTGGYTQQLQEFDRVYLELENPSFGRIRAGDYTMDSRDAYFLGYNKRISGAGVYTTLGDSNQYPLQLQGGLARGKFARNRFQGQEGNQGPYKLTGANGESLIAIISGSERVYIDGVLQKRGEQNDYVMDYNAGEITFTALKPITRQMRITVEFQYSQRSFLRSVASGHSGWNTANWSTQVHYYTEQDSKDQPLTTELSDGDKSTLRRAGDNLEEAVVPTIRSGPYDPDRIQYRLTDSLGFDSVLVYTNDSAGALYEAAFSFVGEKQGHYRLARNGSNGRVFRWVAPQNGLPQGSYSPVRQLIAPNRLEVLELQTGGRLDEHQQLNLRWAASRQDINTFSDRDKGNDLGQAGKLSYRAGIPLDRGILKAEANYEFNQNTFKTVERIRNLEFGRNWNLPLNYQGQVQLGQAQLRYLQDSTHSTYKAELLRARGTRGQRHSLQLRHLDSNHRLRWQASWLGSEDTLRQTDFLRQRGAYRWNWSSRSWVYLRSEGEWNEQRGRQADSLLRRSYRFLEYEAGLGYGDTSTSFAELGYRQRWEDTVRRGRWRSFARSRSYLARGNWKPSSQSELQGNMTLRRLQLPFQNSPSLQTLTSRLNYRQGLWKGAVVSRTFYETGSGSEPRRNFRYIKVPAGTGTYTHTDYNGNGQRELDEFEVAPAPDLANFARVFTATNDFLRTSVVKVGQNLNTKAPREWKDAGGLPSVLARFSSVFSFRLNRKVLQEGNSNALNPFRDPASDTSIVGLNNSLRHSLFFNRSNLRWGGDYTFRQSDNRSLLSFGVERRQITEHSLNLRYRLGEDFLVRTSGSRKEKSNKSGNFSRRTFSILGYTNRYELSYQPGNDLVLTGQYEVRSEESGGEKALSLTRHDAGLETSLNRSENIALQLEAHYIYNGFRGDANSPAAFEMLQALKPGNNAVLEVSWQQTLLQNIVLSLTYQGRFSPNVPGIHSGNVQIKAFL